MIPEKNSISPPYDSSEKQSINYRKVSIVYNQIVKEQKLKKKLNKTNSDKK